MFDYIFNNHFLRFFLYIGYFLNLFLDKGILYIFGPSGLFKTFNLLSYKSITLSSNNYSLINNHFYLFKDNSKIKHFNLYLLFLFFNLFLFFFIGFSNILFLIFFISIPFLF
jgi:hypothetical protein